MANEIEKQMRNAHTESYMRLEKLGAFNANKLAELMIPILIKEGMIKSPDEFGGFMIGADVAEKLFPTSEENDM